MADPRHPEADFGLRKAVGYYPLKDCACCGGTQDCCCHPFSGICGCLPRSIMKGMTGAGGGKSGVYEHETKHGGAGFVEKFKADKFWWAAALDSWGAHHDGNAILGDVKRTLTAKWTYETRDIKCPVRIFQGKG